MQPLTPQGQPVTDVDAAQCLTCSEGHPANIPQRGGWYQCKYGHSVQAAKPTETELNQPGATGISNRHPQQAD